MALILGVNANALISLSTQMDSPAFRVCATAITILLVLAWLVLAPLTLINVRSLLKIPKNDTKALHVTREV
jgi:tellurite resistance protein TehA-like permease